MASTWMISYHNQELNLDRQPKTVLILILLRFVYSFLISNFLFIKKKKMFLDTDFAHG